jgi:rhodanese-related sulfurtransferase
MFDNILIDNKNITNILEKKLTIIDIRNPIDYNKQHIKTALNIPINIFEDYKNKLSKNIPIFLICHSGKASYTLALSLRQEGFHAYSIKGGMYELTHNIPNQYY